MNVCVPQEKQHNRCEARGSASLLTKEVASPPGPPGIPSSLPALPLGPANGVGCRTNVTNKCVGRSPGSRAQRRQSIACEINAMSFPSNAAPGFWNPTCHPALHPCTVTGGVFESSTREVPQQPQRLPPRPAAPLWAPAAAG